MQEVFEKIKKKLATELIYYSGYPDCSEYDYAYEIAMQDANNKARKIVNEVAEEYNNGWIPCSSGKLPEDGVDVLVWFEYFRYGSYNRLFQTIGISYTYNGDWSGFVNGQSGWNQLSIIAWQPLPEPFQKGERE